MLSYPLSDGGGSRLLSGRPDLSRDGRLLLRKRNRRRSWQMRGRRVESGFIGEPVDCVSESVITYEWIRASHDVNQSEAAAAVLALDHFGRSLGLNAGRFRGLVGKVPRRLFVDRRVEKVMRDALRGSRNGREGVDRGNDSAVEITVGRGF